MGVPYVGLPELRETLSASTVVKTGLLKSPRARSAHKFRPVSSRDVGVSKTLRSYIQSMSFGPELYCKHHQILHVLLDKCPEPYGMKDLRFTEVHGVCFPGAVSGLWVVARRRRRQYGSSSTNFLEQQDDPGAWYKTNLRGASKSFSSSQRSAVSGLRSLGADAARKLPPLPRSPKAAMSPTPSYVL